LEGERDEFLGRGRHVGLDESHDNYRNGYRPRRINFFGLGKIGLEVPRDRKGEFQSQWLPERKGQDPELEAFLAEAFLAGLSTRDLVRITEKHLGHKYDSKQISRIVGRATTELEAWRRRSLRGSITSFSTWTGPTFWCALTAT
jgi:transposase-like protein